MFQLAPLTISTYKRQLFGSCGADKTCVFLRHVAKMILRFLKQRTNITFCVKLGKNASDIRVTFSEASGGEPITYYMVQDVI
jgi:hypothetical protein